MTTQTPNIGEQAQAFMAGTAAAMPADVMRAFVDEQDELDAAGTPTRRRPPRGPRCPTVTCSTCRGGPTTLAEVTRGQAGGRGVLPGRVVPVLQRRAPDVRAGTGAGIGDRGVATMVALSPQKPDGSLTTQETNALTYAVVSDPGNQIAGKLGILTAPTARPASRSWRWAWTSPRSTPTARPRCRCRPRSCSTPTASSGGSTCTRTTRPAARCPTSWRRWTRSSDLHRRPRCTNRVRTARTPRLVA